GEPSNSSTDEYTPPAQQQQQQQQKAPPEEGQRSAASRLLGYRLINKSGQAKAAADKALIIENRQASMSVDDMDASTSTSLDAAGQKVPTTVPSSAVASGRKRLMGRFARCAKLPEM